MELQKRGKNSNQSGNINDFWGQYGKFVLIGGMVLALVLAIVLISGLFGKDPADGSSEGSETGSETETDEIYISDFSRYDLKKDAYPEINRLYETYYTAMKVGDVATLSGIVDGYEFTQEEVDKEGEYVENYRNIVCYTLDGLVKDTYIVYVYYEVKFYNIDTWAPGLYGSYVCRNSDGSVYIKEGLVDGEVAAYIDEMDNSELVRDLKSLVDQALLDAQAKDASLDKLVKMLQEGASQNNAADPTKSTEPKVDITFKKVEELVAATQTVNVRKSPSTEGSKAGVLSVGETVRRTGYHEDWSRVEFKGKTCYIKTEYLEKAE